MNATVKDNELRINLLDLVERMPDDVKHEIGKHFAFDEELIRMVVEMVGSGVAFEEDGGWWYGNPTLARIREGLVPLMDNVSQGLIEHLIHEREQEHIEVDRWKTAYWKLWHHHNDTRDRECGDLAPSPPELLQPSWPTTADYERIVAEAREKWGVA